MAKVLDESEQTRLDSGGQGSLACCGPWDRRVTNDLAYSNIWASQVALVAKNLPANAGDVRDAGLIPGSGRCPGGGSGNPLQDSCLENSI